MKINYKIIQIILWWIMMMMMMIASMRDNMMKISINIKLMFRKIKIITSFNNNKISTYKKIFD